MDEDKDNGVRIQINGREYSVPEGTTVAIAINTAQAAYRRSVTSEPRAPLCGMGTCFECRVQIDGRPHTRSCQLLCRTGMQVMTDE